jgi:hypothetical protein
MEHCAVVFGVPIGGVPFFGTPPAFTLMILTGPFVQLPKRDLDKA